MRQLPEPSGLQLHNENVNAFVAAKRRRLDRETPMYLEMTVTAKDELLICRVRARIRGRNVN